MQRDEREFLEEIQAVVEPLDAAIRRLEEMINKHLDEAPPRESQELRVLVEEHWRAFTALRAALPQPESRPALHIVDT